MIAMLVLVLVLSRGAGAGSVCDFRLQYGRSLSKHSKIIAVNRSKSELYLNSDRFWTPAAGQSLASAIH